MRNTILRILLFTSGILFFSCQDSFEEHQVGKDLINSNSEVFVTDTVYVKSSTVMLDSIITSQTSLIGSYHDEFLGKVKSDTYFRLMPNSSFNLTEQYKPVLDSVVAIFKPNKYYYGDTLKSQSFKLFLVEEEMKHKLDKDLDFYNNQSFDISSEAIAENENVSTFPNGYKYEKQDNDIRLVVSGQTGTDFVNLLFGEAFKIGLENRVNNYFRWDEISHGLAITSSDVDANMFSMNPKSFKLRFYYHDDLSEPITKEQELADRTGRLEEGSHRIFDFVMDKSVQFSNITTDRTSSVIKDLVSQDTQLDKIEEHNGLKNLTFIQAGTGLLTRIDFPSVREINKLGFDRTLLKAELLFYPLLNTQNNNERRLPMAFNIFQTNSLNKKVHAIMKSQKAPLTSVFVASAESELESYYSFNLTSHINALLNDNDRNQASLLISPINMNNTFNRMILSNTRSNKHRIKLKLTYVVHE